MFAYFFENNKWLVNLHILLQKKEWLARTLRINYWNVHKPAMLRNQLCSVLFIAVQAKISMKTIPEIYRAIMEKMKHSLMKCILIHESHNTSISAM